MAEPGRRATYADLAAVPEHLIGEIIDGVLLMRPRLPRQGAATLQLMGALVGGRGERDRAPIGWNFLYKPELHFGEEIVVPDYAGWRGDRFPFSADVASITIVPDWVCEFLPSSPARLDLGMKRHAYAEAGVQHLWLLDRESGVLEAFTLVGQQWLLLATVQRGEALNVAPFDAISFPLNDLFPFDTPPASEA